MAERFSNLGYLSLVKEATKGTPLTPTDFIPLYEESLSTNLNFIDQQPIYGNKFETYTTLQGQRSHKGDVTVLAEPNTTAKIADMLLTKVSTTGAGPYTHTFEFSASANPNSYTIDISTGNVVSRYWGVEASKLSPVWKKNELQWKVSLSALGSFQGREIGSVTTTTLTLKTDYDPTPNKGLVVGDLVRIYKSSTGATLDTTIASVAGDGVTVTLAASAAAFAAGDMIYLRPATQSFTLLPSFLWAKTNFNIAATAAAAVSAAQTRVEQGSTFEIAHNFNSDDGEDRSGGFDPAALIRTTGNSSLNIKRFFDTPEDITNMNNLATTAAVIRHFAGSTNQYEARVVFNALKTDGAIVPDLKQGDILFSDIKYHPNYNQTDGKALQFIVVNNLSTI